MSAFRQWLSALAAVFVLSGCMTPYQSQGFTGGYTDQKVNDTVYWVTFAGNGNTPRERVFRFWLYRCAELADQSGYAYFGLLGTTKPSAATDAGYQHVSDAAVPYQVARSGTSSVPIYVPTYTGGYNITTYSARGYIRLLQQDPAPGNPRIFRAKQVLADLGSEIKAAPGNDTAATTNRAYDPNYILRSPARSVTTTREQGLPAPDSAGTSMDDLFNLLPSQ